MFAIPVLFRSMGICANEQIREQTSRKGVYMDSSIISSILEIDRSAKEKLAEAEDRKNRIIADAKAEQERIIGERVKNADETLKKLEEEEKRKADEKLSAINAEGEKELKRLEEVYEARHEKWEEQIFRAVTNG